MCRAARVSGPGRDPCGGWGVRSAGAAKFAGTRNQVLLLSPFPCSGAAAVGGCRMQGTGAVEPVPYFFVPARERACRTGLFPLASGTGPDAPAFPLSAYLHRHIHIATIWSAFPRACLLPNSPIRAVTAAGLAERPLSPLPMRPSRASCRSMQAVPPPVLTVELSDTAVSRICRPQASSRPARLSIALYSLLPVFPGAPFMVLFAP